MSRQPAADDHMQGSRPKTRCLVETAAGLLGNRINRTRGTREENLQPLLGSCYLLGVGRGGGVGCPNLDSELLKDYTKCL